MGSVVLSLWHCESEMTMPSRIGIACYLLFSSTRFILVYTMDTSQELGRRRCLQYKAVQAPCCFNKSYAWTQETMESFNGPHDSKLTKMMSIFYALKFGWSAASCLFSLETPKIHTTQWKLKMACQFMGSGLLRYNGFLRQLFARFLTSRLI